MALVRVAGATVTFLVRRRGHAVMVLLALCVKAPVRRMMTIHCTSHCATCGTHFHSTQAFDRHRQFEEGFKDDWGHRICIEPADDPRFEALTDAGLCDIYPSRVKRGVTVWTNAGAREKAARIRRQ